MGASDRVLARTPPSFHAGGNGFRLIVTRDEDQGTEGLQWIELSTYGNAKDGSSVVALPPEESKEYVRPIQALFRDRTVA